MRLLLDTHAFLWFCEGNEALTLRARMAIENQEHERYVSHATAWELAIKVNLKKLTLQVPYESLFPGVLQANGFKLLPPTLTHYQALLDLPLHHRDPFDRLLIAQAKAEGLTLVTLDSAFAAYGVPILW